MVAEQYESFASRVFPTVPTNSIQYRDLKMTFFAGAISVLDVFRTMQLAELNEETVMAALEALEKETDDFSKDVIRQAMEMN